MEISQFLEIKNKFLENHYTFIIHFHFFEQIQINQRCHRDHS